MSGDEKPPGGNADHAPGNKPARPAPSTDDAGPSAEILPAANRLPGLMKAEADKATERDDLAAADISKEQQDADTRKAHREHRKWTFWVLGSVCIGYLLALGWTLFSFFRKGPLVDAVLSNNPANWHPLVLLGIALVIFATVPLTLTMALVRMISEGGSESQPGELKIPLLEGAKVIVEGIKTIKGG